MTFKGIDKRERVWYIAGVYETSWVQNEPIEFKRNEHIGGLFRFFIFPVARRMDLT